MKTIKKISLLSIISFALFITSCVKEGPVGPKGDTGAQGATGPQGDAGVHSYTWTLTASSWAQSAPSYYANLNFPALTQTILDNGVFMAYIGNGSGGWIGLPLTSYYSNTYSTTYTPVFYAGGLTVWVTDSDLTQTGNPGNQQIKAVIVSAGRMEEMNEAHIDRSNYNQVKAFLNLKD